MSRSWKYAALAVAGVILAGGAAPRQARAGMAADGIYSLSEPVTSGNLAIYLVHGPSRGGVAPLTLQEALGRGAVALRETGQVNQLMIENTGGEAVFIQAGDIVKGGQQDRVLGVSMLLPPFSGAIALTAFCVEHGRWSQRGGESKLGFASSDAVAPTREIKAAIAAAAAPPSPSPDGAMALAEPVARSQQRIWDSVGTVQSRLSSALAAPVRAEQSPSSLQLSLENPQLARSREIYVKALGPVGLADSDVVGFVFAVNGKLDSAEIYPSNALFRKLWPKLLRAAATEALAAQEVAGTAPPPATQADRMLGAGVGGKVIEGEANALTRVRTTETAEFTTTEWRPIKAADDGWIHRRILAK